MHSDTFTQSVIDFSNWLWGLPLMLLLMCGGLFFLIYSGFLPYRYFGHGISVLRGKYHTQGPGQLSPYQALSTALASTVGMGNIAGVAVAISTGGPGAIFWMWVSAIVGMATNFFTCAQASMFRGKDSRGDVQGGPMYVITEGLGASWKPLAVIFCICCLFGTLPIFQANQLTQAIRDVILVPSGIGGHEWAFGEILILDTDLYTGILLAVITSIVVIGGIKRIGSWAGRMVPLMVVIYFITVVIILVIHVQEIPHYLGMIFSNAFTGENFKGEKDPITGGVLGGLIVLGARRASFSNEAGIGTAPLAMGAAKSSEPIHEGLVAMLSPAIDTLLVCTCTAMAILATGVWQTSDSNGVSLTANAFEVALPNTGHYILMICIFFFSVTSLFSYSYYGVKSTSFLIGAARGHWYNYFYIAMILVGATSSLSFIMSVIDASYALMALPTMISGILLAPKVNIEARKYFQKLRQTQEDEEQNVLDTKR